MWSWQQAGMDLSVEKVRCSGGQQPGQPAGRKAQPSVVHGGRSGGQAASLVPFLSH